MEEFHNQSSSSNSGSGGNNINNPPPFKMTNDLLQKYDLPENLEMKVDALIQNMTKHEIWSEARVGTFNCILLPPSLPFVTGHKTWADAKWEEAKWEKGEGAKWVDDVFACLEDNGELDIAIKRPRHVTLIMTSEFAFNRAPGMERNGAWPIPDWMEAEIQERVQYRLRTREAYRKYRIIFAFSCCSTHDELGINRVSIITPWKDLQYIEKLRPAEAGDDGWNTNKFKIKKEHESSKEENEVKAIQRPESRIFVDNFEPQNCTIAIGLGTCRDIMFEEYPDVSLIAVPAGALTERPFYNTQLEGFVINDAEYWDPQDDGSFIVNTADNLQAGYREFEKREPGLQKQVFPNKPFDAGLGPDYRYHYGPTFPDGNLHKVLKFQGGSGKPRGQIIVTPTRPFPKRSRRKRIDKGQPENYPKSTPPESVFRKHPTYFEKPEAAVYDEGDAIKLLAEIDEFERQILKDDLMRLFGGGHFAFSKNFANLNEDLWIEMYVEGKKLRREQRWSNLAEAFIEYKRDNKKQHQQQQQQEQ